jgi:DNA-binding CsgD family transcriptional regulator
MAEAIDTDQVSQLIGLIYDCVIDPARWPQAVQVLRNSLGFANCSLSLVTLPDGRPLLNVQSGITAEWEAKIPLFSHGVPNIWGGVQRMQQYPLDEPIVNSEAVDPAIWAGNPWYEQWSRPQQLADVVAITFMRDPSSVGAVAFGIHDTQGTITERQRIMLRLLGPHFRRAISISKLLDMQAVKVNMLQDTIDKFSIPILFVDAALSLVQCNVAATELLDNQDIFTTRQNQIRLLHKDTTAALAEAVRRAAISDLELGQRGIGLPVRRKSGAPAVIHVLPLRITGSYAGVPANAVAALFVAGATASPKMPAEALTVLYDLSPAETRVLELLVEGRTIAEASGELGISANTGKSHLQRVFEKTGANRQVDLVRLISSLNLPF